MNLPPIVSQPEWDAARDDLLIKEKALTRARDALAAERRQMPRMAVEREYVFEGPEGQASLLDLFEGRRQLIVYRFFFEPGVSGWPESGCRGCSFMADQVAHLAHLNSRDTTLAYVSRAPQADIEHHGARAPGGLGGLAGGLAAGPALRVVEPPRRLRRGDRLRGGALRRRRLPAGHAVAAVIARREEVTETRTLRIERRYQAPATAVFDAWTSEEVMRRWWQAEHHWETSEAEVDLHVGGAVRVVMLPRTRVGDRPPRLAADEAAGEDG